MDFIVYTLPLARLHFYIKDSYKDKKLTEELVARTQHFQPHDLKTFKAIKNEMMK